jgi:hypothetical protein
MNQELLGYWPTQRNVKACMESDAEAASEAVTMAVHQPLQFRRRTIGSQSTALTSCDEQELLAALLEPDPFNGRVILPITGASGIGKSHVIRWLDAQVRHSEGADNRLVVRIPKGTSLRGVLGILIKCFSGEEYERFHQELSRAQDVLKPDEVAGLLCEHLAQALEEMGAGASAKRLDNPSDKTLQEIEAYCRKDMLPTLFRLQLLRDEHFVRTKDGKEGIVTKLVQQLTTDRTAANESAREDVFHSDDLAITSVDRTVLGRAENRALDSLDRPERREAATKVLNMALDDAKGRILRLDPTITDLFDDVRKGLLAQGKELVLLIEDFVVFSGLQKQLLQVIIKEARRDGRQYLCTMRTAIAYTTGYMDTDTFMTRAGVEYQIPNEPGTEEEIFTRIERLVGAYLNAARFGQYHLESVYDAAKGEVGLESWVPKFRAEIEDDAQVDLAEFGITSDGYELFPFNSSAIRELSREACLIDNRLAFNPRFVIQNVLNPVLNGRPFFESDRFPSPNLGTSTRQLPFRVIEDLKILVPTSEIDRYLTFLRYWAGFPSTLAEASQTPARVFQAFGLNSSLLTRGVSPTDQRATTQPKATPAATAQEQTPATRPEQNAVEAKWEKLFNNWGSGQALLQADANNLRKMIATAVGAAVDWDWDLYRPRKEDSVSDPHFEYVYIPRAGGGHGLTPENAMVSVCSESDLDDPVKSAGIQSALMAMIRFQEVYKSNWDYPDAESDLAKYTAFVAKRTQRAREFVRGRYFRADWNPIPALVQGLLIGGRALGIEAATKDKDHAALISSIFSEAPAPEIRSSTEAAPMNEIDPWRDFSGLALDCRRASGADQKPWRDMLLDQIGARQGQASRVHAIDVMRLRPSILATLSKWEFDQSMPNPTRVVEFGPFRQTYSRLKDRSSAIAKTQQQLCQWQVQALEWFGEEFDKEGFVQTLKDTIETARSSGVAVGLEVKSLLQLVEEFRGAKVMAALEDIGKLATDAPRGQVLTVLGRGHQATAQLCDRLRAQLESFLTGVNAQLVSDAQKYGEDPIQEAIQALSGEIDEISTLLDGAKSL